MGSLVRTIELISCNEFLFTPIWASSGVYDVKGETVSVAFTIPDNFPSAFFPLDIKIACNYLDGVTSGLEVIFEDCTFTVDGTEYTRDWSHKFQYTVTEPGLHKVDFQTVLSENGSSLEFFVEADNFKTRRIEIPLIAEDRTIALGLHSGTSDASINWVEESGSVDILPIGGQGFPDFGIFLLHPAFIY